MLFVLLMPPALDVQFGLVNHSHVVGSGSGVPACLGTFGGRDSLPGDVLGGLGFSPGTVIPQDHPTEANVHCGGQCHN